MTDFEYRICRSLENDDVSNTLDLYPGPTFAMLEFLDHKDSQYFAKYLLRKKWTDITPDAHKKEHTWYWKKPPDNEVRDFESTIPDWFYISGHYARTGGVCGIPGATRTSLPTGFFNEHFHKNEWVSEWKKTHADSMFLQTETLDGAEDEFRKMMEQAWLKDSPQSRDETIKEWSEIWDKPNQEVTLNNVAQSAVRGMLTGKHWEKVKVVMLVGCNTLFWNKTVFHEVFPNALILGYVNKNPANGTPHIAAFLKNLFRDISSGRDPRLFDHKHIAKAWMDVHRKQRLNKSARMAYMTTDGHVFAFDSSSNEVDAGLACDVVGRHDSGTLIGSINFFAVQGGAGLRTDF